MIESFVARYWGKARPVEGGDVGWHPLAYHSLDVAAAMEALLVIRPGWLWAIAEGSGLSPDETARRLTLAAALHDLGKFAENFQAKVPERAEGNGLVLGPEAQSTAGHGDVGHAFWNEFRDSDASLEPLNKWLLAAFAHHGAPTNDGVVRYQAMTARAYADAASYIAAARRLIGSPSEARVASAAETWRVAGLVVLADWIGSNQAWFPYTAPEFDLESYWTRARRHARAAVVAAELPEAPTADLLTLSMLLPGDADASPLQAWAAAESVAREPTLYVVEDLTGSGKTEAALLLAHRLMAAGRAEGIYWALPTMATANGLYRRLGLNYTKLFGAGAATPSLALAHSARDLNTAFQASIPSEYRGRYGAGRDAQDQSAEAHCAAFIADDRKKTFLAQVAVGTLDQALLGVLPVRHQSLRLAALSRRVLVVDEAHAYDPYMTALLERLLEFQARLGGSAIVLSATLTAGQRRRLCAAFNSSASDVVRGTDFPLITRASASAIGEFPQPAQRGTRRDLAWRRWDVPQAAMNGLLQAIEPGYCGVYIRNTVKDAIAAAAYLRDRAPPGVTVELFHARFALGDRLAREAAALDRFGPNSSPAERAGRILVSTQVVEQSLDLDFDFLVTDLCPMDLLIQRAGRLHRHGRATARPPPVLEVVAPAADPDVGGDWYAALFPNGRYVYPDVGQLWRTARVLEHYNGLTLATASTRDLMEAVFGDAPLDIPTSLTDESDRAMGKRIGDRAIGLQNVLQPPRFERAAGLWGSDDRTPTRLGEASVTVRLARWQDGRLSPWFADADPYRAWRLSEVALRASQFVESLPANDACAKAIEAIRQSWPGRFDPPAVLAMTALDDAQRWLAMAIDARGRRSEVTYSIQLGLQL